MDKNYKHIKSYVLRSSRMSSLQKKAYNSLKDKYIIPYSEGFLDFKKKFNNENIIIEIGFGMGEATVEIAKNHPDKKIIAIEVHKPGIGKLLDEIEKNNLNNISIIEYDAVKVFHDMIPDDSLYGVHIFFPDPWPKKRHHKRRLIKKEFIEIIGRKLKKRSYIYIATDWEHYAYNILEILNSVDSLKNKFNDFAEKISWRPETRFEEKGLKKSHKIWELYFFKN